MIELIRQREALHSRRQFGDGFLVRQRFDRKRPGLLIELVSFRILRVPGKQLLITAAEHRLHAIPILHHSGILQLHLVNATQIIFLLGDLLSLCQQIAPTLSITLGRLKRLRLAEVNRRPILIDRSQRIVRASAKSPPSKHRTCPISLVVRQYRQVRQFFHRDRPDLLLKYAGVIQIEVVRTAQFPRRIIAIQIRRASKIKQLQRSDNIPLQTHRPLSPIDPATTIPSLELPADHVSVMVDIQIRLRNPSNDIRLLLMGLDQLFAKCIQSIHLIQSTKIVHRIRIAIIKLFRRNVLLSKHHAKHRQRLLEIPFIMETDCLFHRRRTLLRGWQDAQQRRQKKTNKRSGKSLHGSPFFRVIGQIRA